MAAENDPRQIKYRLMTHNMTISATAVIAFGAWSILRSVLYFTLHHVDFVAMMDAEFSDNLSQLGENAHTATNIVAYCVFLSFLIFDLLLRLYVGRSAITDAKMRKKKTVLYIIIAIFMGISLVSGFISEVAVSFSDDITERIFSELMASSVIDLTSGFACLELAFSAIAARGYRKKLRAEGKMPIKAGEK